MFGLSCYHTSFVSSILRFEAHENFLPFLIASLPPYISLKSIFHVGYPIMFTAFKCVICSIFLPQHISAFGKGCIVVDLRITYAITSISYVTHLRAIAHVARGLHFFFPEQSMWRIGSHFSGPDCFFNVYLPLPLPTGTVVSFLNHGYVCAGRHVSF